MSMTGNEGAVISLEDAKTLTANYRNAIKVGETISYTIGANLVNQIITQEGCKGLRIYRAKDELGADQIVLVGVDASSKDMYTGVLVDRVILCPPLCPSVSPLNGND